LAEEFGAPAGSAVSLGIHESQSRLWENHVGRSQAFWGRWFPRAQELFPALRRVALQDFMRTIHRAEFSFIRVEADEATYDLHILLRFDLERRLLSGDLEVRDIPKAWNTGFEALFGLTPPDDARGCLQDIHWSMGGLGYFATYTLGNLNAAQLFRTAMQERDVAAGFRKGEYQPLLDWLRKAVHVHGATFAPRDLVRKATGRFPEPTDYLAHLEKRFV
jgi:carboxypeptidase Taq